MLDESALGTTGISRRQLLAAGGLGLTAAALTTACSKAPGSSSSTDVGDGLDTTQLADLAPFEFSDSVGAKPNVPHRFSFVQIDNVEGHTQQQAVTQQACQDRGIDFEVSNSQSDPAKVVQQVNTFLQKGTGAVQLLPLGTNVSTIAHQVFSRGAALFNQVQGPSTCQQTVDNYALGQAQGQAAVDWIRKNLGGRATVAYLNPNALAPVLAARTNGALKAFSQESGIKVINIGMSPSDWTPTGGYKQTSTLLQAHPDLTAIVSGDAPIAGALKAVQAAHNTSVKYIGGCDGEDLVLNYIKQGDTLIKGTIGLGIAATGYAAGQFTADWFEGKTIPQACIFTPVIINSPDAVSEYADQVKNPAKYWKNPKYQTFRGAISYETRKKWIKNALVGASS
ncbi:sugar ABC transporter substrate-binding protein [Candidatus Protofrankia californiensis]|uniref:sugar ABC transporter substrate-binding protein n=1 Tax=Candidatus Protofrankia californiensis TaxID=1839754 RepID=UPI001040FB41|nr:sugar ABC transporter substrate-binding protein [Candidatus Protofrankia californiensis]